MQNFSKVLTTPDVERRLSFPIGSEAALPRSQGCHVMVLQVEDDAGILWNFGCKMQPGVIPKLVLVSGWIQFVRSKGLRNGDIVNLSKEEGAHYKIQVKRSDTLSSGQKHVCLCK
ncbi:putative AP2/ERF and B3 domain-containing protein Os01g0140700 [Durio zibethinus]|uniref:AP2/ERF and B3 domain-containing protein Os01g0140700 n=1 Tax=Durio zibethinus TaxID=66656 RepID=A0A6P5Z8P2_DURZI|nr:putative AP2/ERF and B3 domain-containing protein Os01g0140700 [Durio zibethinus]